ncbi:hypothetical protein GGQ87_002973 [Brevundimonas alba]|uniref:Uncharacterized protein n=1 Tax=Brevundimonas alba TaxID=74314 RepID=A0A7X5YMJ2_9CAUL|nr:hypothetical protein [Brevundimonas alba]
MLSAGHTVARPSSRGRTLGAVIRGLFCRHQWDTSRSRKGTFVCRGCGARKG